MELPKIVDARGNLTMIEAGHHLPFDIARAYYIYDVPSGSTRAGHAHRRLKQLFLALSGSFSLHLEDGRKQETFLLNRPHNGVLVEPGVWRMIDNFSGGAVCLVLASMHYDESDYIRSYDDFLHLSLKELGLPPFPAQPVELPLSLGLFLADTFAKLGYFDNAIALYRQLASKYNSYEAYCGLADVLIVLSRWRREFEEHELDGQIVDGYGLSREPLPTWRTSRSRDAVDAASAAAALRPDLEASYWLLALSHHEDGDPIAAESDVARLRSAAAKETAFFGHLFAKVTFPSNPLAAAQAITNQLSGWTDHAGREWRGDVLTEISAGDLVAIDLATVEVFPETKRDLELETKFIRDDVVTLQRKIHFEQAFCATYRDATLLPLFGGVSIRDEYWVKESTHYKSGHLEVFTPAIRSQRDGKLLCVKPSPDTVSDGNLAFIGNNANYYHWLIDDLPRLSLLRANDELGDRRIAVDRNIKNWMVELLDRLGVAEDRLLKLPFDRPLRFERLTAPSTFVRGYAAHPYAVKRMRADLLEGADERRCTKGKRLYLRRKAAADASRFFLNAPEVEEMFERAGFRFVDPGRLKIQEQIDLFSDAEIVAGPSGAAMTNMLFAPRDAKLLLLGAKDVTGETFTSLTSAIGQKSFWCLGDGFAQTYGRWILTNFDFCIAKRDVKTAIDAVLSA